MVNFYQQISRLETIQDCQWFCTDIYSTNCTWFLYDRTTKVCKLFKGSLDDFQNDCKEVGYAKNPSHSECLPAFTAMSDNGCYVSVKIFMILYLECVKVTRYDNVLDTRVKYFYFCPRTFEKIIVVSTWTS